ncbi:hypothetical protein DDZ13_08135 [Coraliomargarita sinensis]|uniref:site-specific DNA-methyltransferase (adenine-specific) n=1 Tax=Coraliomargarita sinensis TaxID=2174842 RepID=A0A317ZET5_9BACT|nr:N-6 DNA methylase [Coraliomargarita sinensis]PXA04004.1 hypothetical protein DDZ13_08135 [Coraliomargarita sinensis]
MSQLLQELCLAPVDNKPALSGLVSVHDDTLPPESIAESVARREASLLKDEKQNEVCGIDFIFFRRFSDGRSPQVAAYVVDNSKSLYSKDALAELHRRVWLNGSAPLLYVEWPTQVDILRCATKPDFWNSRSGDYEYSAAESIRIASDASRALDENKVKRFSAFRLSTGTFWEDNANKDWARADSAAHKLLLLATIEADNCLQKEAAKDVQPVMRRLLLLFVFAKYLEDRGVFPDGWFEDYKQGASSFIDVLKSTDTTAVEKMLNSLKEKFNGDIFTLENFGGTLTPQVLTQFVDLLEAKTLKRQRYLWEQYSFRFIPVSVLSHLYQHFAQSGKGAIYTPPFVADLILDHVLPYDKIQGNEKILDPTCGSGVFLVGAFRRLIHYWQSNNDWSRPRVRQLKDILRRSIFGVEHLTEAANVAALNLALAVCDALQPRVIWDHLKFDTLLGRNLFVGDFFENLDNLKDAAPNGFSCIVGNPPFHSELTQAAKKTRAEDLQAIPIPDGNIAYRVLEECASQLSSGSLMCLLQPSGLLYNSKSRNFAKRFLGLHSVDAVLDFVSIRNLFESADTKAIAILARNEEPAAGHTIRHLTFRRTKSVHERLGFELDHYDLHSVPLETGRECPWVWKVNLLGGGRLVHLTHKVMQWPTLKDFLNEQGWTHGEGFIVGKKSGNKKAEWLKGMPFLPTESLTDEGIKENTIKVVEEEVFAAPRVRARYSPPMLLIGENEKLPSSLWLKGELSFLHSIISINAPENQKEELVKFSESFDKHKSDLRTFCLLKSSRSIIGKSTAILKRDIEELPWPKTDDGFKSLSWWEEILLSDASEAYAPIVRVGHNSYQYKECATHEVFDKYSKTFTHLIGSIYRNIRVGKFGRMDGLAFQAFTFGDSSELDWPDDWSSHLKSILIKKNGAALRTHRIIRFYEKNTLVIVKPDRVRNWIASTAIRDADETLEDLREQGF